MIRNIFTVAFLFIIALEAHSGALKEMKVYNLAHNIYKKNKVELVPVRVIADREFYQYGHAVFSKWNQPLQIRGTSDFEYIQSNIAHIEKLKVVITPVIKKHKIEVFLDFSNCLDNLEILEKKIPLKNIIDGIGAALLFTYNLNSPVVNKIELKQKGLASSMFGEEIIYDLDTEIKKWELVAPN